MFDFLLFPPSSIHVAALDAEYGIDRYPISWQFSVRDEAIPLIDVTIQLHIRDEVTEDRTYTDLKKSEILLRAMGPIVYRFSSVERGYHEMLQCSYDWQRRTTLITIKGVCDPSTITRNGYETHFRLRSEQ